MSIERRLGDRRHHPQTVPVDRRMVGERRRPFDRRETAGGHVRNAIQVLESLLADEPLDDERSEAVRVAIERLWLALREVDRLTVARSHLGFRLRRRLVDFESDAGEN